MKVLITLLFIGTWIQVFGQVKVKGYFRKDGTYVKPHYRSRPDGNPYNNYSYPGNTNPYTGQTAPGNSSTYLSSYDNKHSSTGKGTTMYVNVDRLIARTGPSSTNRIIAVLTYQNLVQIESTENNSWYQARFTFFDSTDNRFKTVTGFIESGFLSESFPDNSISPKNKNVVHAPTTYSSISDNNQNQSGSTQAVPLSSNTWFVSTNQAIARSGPSISENRITILPYQQIVEIVDNINSSWCEIRFTYFDANQSKFRTVNGFIERANLSPKFPEGSPTKSTSTSVSSEKIQYSNPNIIINEPIYPTNYIDYKADYHPYGKGNGQLSIWTNCSECAYIKIYVNDTFAGTISTFFNYQPDPGTKGLFSVIIPAGRLKLTALSNGKRWERFINIIDGKCTMQQLSK